MQKINRALFILLLIYTFLGCGKKQEKIQPTVEPITESVYASGVIKSKNQYQVYSTVNGLLNEIMVNEGDVVKKDQPILRLLNESSKIFLRILFCFICSLIYKLRSLSSLSSRLIHC